MTVLTSVRRRWAAIFALVIILAGAGAYVVRGLPSAIFPTVTFPIVKVIVDVGEEPAARMMPTVTRPVEEAIHRVPGIQLVRSTTSRGSSELSAQFAWGTDMKVALARVQAETQRILPDLPPDTRIDVEWMNPASFPIQGYALTSRTRSQADLLRLAEFTLKPALIRIPGVSRVEIQGGRKREFQVRLDPAALEGRGLSVGDVVSAVRENNDVLSAGLTEQNHELYLTLVNGRVHDLGALSRLAVPVPGGAPATLADLGTLEVADEVSYIRTTADGDSAVLVNLIRQPSANTVSIARGVQTLFRGNPGLLPAGVRWTTFYDQARFVSASVNGTRDAILIGVVLAALVLLVFLRRFRLTVIAVLTIPFTVAIVGLVLGALHQTVNLMTLAGVAAAIGLIADDAIVVVENIERKASGGGHGDPAERGLDEILTALIGSSLSTTLILLPFALLTGVVGAFFRPLALTMAAALTVSFFLAWLWVPAAVGRFGIRRGRDPFPAPVRKGAGDGGDSGPFRRRWRGLGAGLARGYRALVAFLLDRPWVAALVTLTLIGGTAYAYRHIGTDFLPSMDEGSIILDYWTPPGTSLSETDRMLREAEKVIQEVPDVQSYSRRTGTQLGFFITEPNSGDYVINLKPRGKRRPVDEVIDDLRQRIAAVEPAINTDFGQLLEDNIGDLTGGSPQPIDVKIFGSNPEVLQENARRAAKILSGVPGVEDVFDGITIAGPALNIRVDSRAAARYGLTTQDVESAIEPSVTGTVVDQVREGDRVYDLRVLAPTDRPLTDLRIRATDPPSTLVPLSQLATITTGPPEAEIDRENLRTYLGVTARLSGRSLGAAIADIRGALARGLQLPPGMSIRYGGLYQQQQESFRSLLYVLLAGLGLVAVVLLFEFGDWRAPLATAFCAAAVLAGVLAALLLTGTTLNISSYVGAIMMVGIVGENAIFVIHEARLQLEAGREVREAWLNASRRRLRPVAMTVLATSLALAPLAVALGQGSQLMQPLAIAVIGGFVLSGPIVLLLLPALYRWLDPGGKLGSA
jgi:cobalt-zinc-cadmium resistance protein CzcA